MWFWWFWGISVVVCYLVMQIMARANANRLKREFSIEELKKAYPKKSFSELLMSFLPMCIPFINLLIVIICIFSQDAIYEKLKSKIKGDKIMENKNVAVQGAVVPAKSASLRAYDENKFVTIGQEVVKGITTLPVNYDVVASMKSLYLQCINSTQGNLLEKCTPASIEAAIRLVLLNGWQPQKQQCYAVPMGNVLTILPSYHGKQRSAYNNGDVVRGSIKAQVIYQGDTFIDKLLADGRRILVKHEQAPFAERSDIIIGAYAVCQKRVGNKILSDMELMSWKEIQAAWAMSRSGGETHKKFPHEMACKSVIARLCKKLYNWTDENVQVFETTGDIDMANSAVIEPTSHDDTAYDISLDGEDNTATDGNTTAETDKE